MDIAERFLSYVAYETTSDEDSITTPSTAGQLALAAHLARELSDMGLADAVAVPEHEPSSMDR